MYVSVGVITTLGVGPPLFFIWLLRNSMSLRPMSITQRLPAASSAILSANWNGTIEVFVLGPMTTLGLTGLWAFSEAMSPRLISTAAEGRPFGSPNTVHM